MSFFRVGLVSFAAWLLAASAASAGQPFAVTGSAGVYSVLRGTAGFEAGCEAQLAPRRFRGLPRFVPGLSPAVGAMATARGTLYVYGGFRIDVPLGDAWQASPQFAAGLYRHGNQGDERDLGGALELRSGIELSRRIGARSRLGLTFFHLSNAGLYEHNPGSESLVLSYSIRP
jgi:lipid A 3-O-deacylase